jgi:PAS domain S-box-containing protein
LLVTAFAAIVATLFAGVCLLYRGQVRYQLNDAREALTAVSVLKVKQISGWRQDQYDDAAFLQDSFLAGYVVYYLAAPTPAGREVLRAGLLPWKSRKGYADVTLADPGGKVLFSLSGLAGPLPPDEAAAVRQALKLHRPVLTDLHREAGVSPHISAVAPLFTTHGGAVIPAGAVLLHSDAARTLYPLINSWPTASHSSETVLVRRDGDSMLFLNDARYNPHSAFEVRVPLSRREVPSVMSSEGKTGFVEAVDYLHSPVFADIRPVPGTSWVAITKIAADEAMAPVRDGAVQLACLLGGLLTAVAALFFALWQFRARAQAQLLLEAETARSAAAGRLAAIVEGSRDAIIATTIEGVVTAWNRAAERIFGYSAGEMIGQGIDRLLPPGQRLDPGAVAGIRGQAIELNSYEAVRATKDGRLIDVAVSLSPINGVSGPVTGSSGIVRDITAQKHTEAALREVEQRFERLFMEAPLGIAVIGSLTRRMYVVNPAFGRIVGRPVEEMRNSDWMSMTHPDDVQASLDNLAAMNADRTPGYHIEKRYLHPDGATVWVSMWIAPLAVEDPAQPRHLCMIEDITVRKETQEKLQEARSELIRSNRELEHFAHVASHDLQEPLRMVASYTQLLAQRYHGQLDQDARDFIGYAVDGATRMKQLIEDLLAYSRVTARGLPVSVVDSGNAFSLALSNLEAAVTEAHAEVSCGELPAVRADDGQMVQLFQNLVSNAIKFRTPGVPPRVRVEASRSPDPGGRWIFRVADNGIGIDPKFFERVFVMFQRLHTRHEYPGTGIGLALCQRIVERHGGRIWIESSPGQGTAFLFTLPEADPGNLTVEGN